MLKFFTQRSVCTSIHQKIKTMTDNTNIPSLEKAQTVSSDKCTKEEWRELFDKLSQPLSCGIIRGGVRCQKSGTEWSSERIFVLSNELSKPLPDVHFRSYFNTDDSWREAISLYLRGDRWRLHPILYMYCIQRDVVTCRKLDFEFDIVSC